MISENSGPGRSDPVKEPAGYFFKELSVNRTNKVIGNPEEDSAGKTKNTGGDRHGAQRIKYCLPLIGGGKSDTDASDHADIRKDRGRKEHTDAKEDNRTDDVSGNTSFDSFFHICAERKQHRHGGNPDPHGSWNMKKSSEKNCSRNAEGYGQLPACPK